MGSLGPTQLIALLLAVATIAAISGFVASNVVREKSDAHVGPSFFGFFCGLLAARYCAEGVAA